MSGDEEAFLSPGRTITETDLVSFSALTGDWHPQHSDAVWAADSEFGERVAHGMMILSYAVGLAPIDPARVLALRGIEDVVFKRAVKVGDTIRLESELEGRRPLGDGVELATFRWRVRNQDDQLTVRARVTVLARTALPDGEGEG